MQVTTSGVEQSEEEISQLHYEVTLLSVLRQLLPGGNCIVIGLAHTS